MCPLINQGDGRIRTKLWSSQTHDRDLHPTPPIIFINEYNLIEIWGPKRKTLKGLLKHKTKDENYDILLLEDTK